MPDISTHEYDFANAELPSLTPLKKSFAADQTETELKEIFLEVFKQTLAASTFDVNVSGAAHLGSFDLVRRVITTDGLSLLQGDREEPAVRYLYRAWIARDNQGRGMHFLRAYLQTLFPNLCSVEQMWQDKDEVYPLGLHTSLDGDDFVIDPEKMYLTSRVEIALDLTISTRSITTLTDIFRTILPARLVPQFRFWLIFNISIQYKLERRFFMEKHSEVYMPWNVLLVTERPSALWYLGRDENPEEAPKLKEGRITGSLIIEKVAQNSEK
jgi:hypothetical protein